jgi:hypothetical protein
MTPVPKENNNVAWRRSPGIQDKLTVKGECHNSLIMRPIKKRKQATILWPAISAQEEFSCCIC